MLRLDLPGLVGQALRPGRERRRIRALPRAVEAQLGGTDRRRGGVRQRAGHDGFELAQVPGPRIALECLHGLGVELARSTSAFLAPGRRGVVRKARDHAGSLAQRSQANGDARERLAEARFELLARFFRRLLARARRPANAQGREARMSRHTELDPSAQLLLDRFGQAIHLV